MSLTMRIVKKRFNWWWKFWLRTETYIASASTRTAKALLLRRAPFVGGNRRLLAQHHGAPFTESTHETTGPIRALNRRDNLHLIAHQHSDNNSPLPVLVVARSISRNRIRRALGPG